MTLDEKLKARAQREGSPTPEGFHERMDALLRDLPAQVTPVKKRRARRAPPLCIGIAAALVVGAAAAAPTVLEMARNAIGYFTQNSGSEYAEYQGKYEKYNAAVGMSDTNGDQTLTIDNLAVDDSYMLVFYTLKSKTPIEVRSEQRANRKPPAPAGPPPPSSRRSTASSSTRPVQSKTKRPCRTNTR